MYHVEVRIFSVEQGDDAALSWINIAPEITSSDVRSSVPFHFSA